MTTETLPGDWRAGAHGGNRLAHLFIWQMGGRKGPACGVRAGSDYLRRNEGITQCSECRRYIARMEAL